MQTNIVTEIRKYHKQVVSADKSIAGIGKEQIQAAFKCGKLLAKERKKTPPNGWGKWCKKNVPQISDDTIDRYIKLSETAVLRKLKKKYRTLYEAYIGEGILKRQRKRVTVKATPNNGNGNGGNGNDAKPTETADHKAKVRGGGDVDSVMKAISPEARAQMEKQLFGDGSQSQPSESAPTNYRSTPASGASNRLETAKRLISELAKVLEQDKTPTTENLKIYDAMFVLAKWHREQRVLQARDPIPRPAPTTKDIQSEAEEGNRNRLAELSKSTVDIPLSPQPEETLAE